MFEHEFRRRRVDLDGLVGPQRAGRVGARKGQRGGVAEFVLDRAAVQRQRAGRGLVEWVRVLPGRDRVGERERAGAAPARVDAVPPEFSCSSGVPLTSTGTLNDTVIGTTASVPYVPFFAVEDTFVTAGRVV